MGHFIDVNPFAVIVGGLFFVGVVALFIARRIVMQNPGPIQPVMASRALGSDKPELVDVYIDVRKSGKRKEVEIGRFEEVMVCLCVCAI